MGNRISTSRNPGSGVQTDSYAYPATSNRLGSIALAGGGTRAFTYDAAGNVTQDNRTAGGAYGYTYDAAGRMASFSIDGVVQATYKYNHLGQQAVRSYPGSGLEVHSVFDFAGHRIAE